MKRQKRPVRGAALQGVLARCSISRSTGPAQGAAGYLSVLPPVPPPPIPAYHRRPHPAQPPATRRAPAGSRHRRRGQRVLFGLPRRRSPTTTPSTSRPRTRSNTPSLPHPVRRSIRLTGLTACRQRLRARLCRRLSPRCCAVTPRSSPPPRIEFFVPPSPSTPAPPATIDTDHPGGEPAHPAASPSIPGPRTCFVDTRTYIYAYDPSGVPIEEGRERLQIGLGSLEDGYGLAVSAFPALPAASTFPTRPAARSRSMTPTSTSTEPIEEIDEERSPRRKVRLPA